MTDWRDKFIEEGLTFSDISLRPQFSRLTTRSGGIGGPDTSVQLTPKIKLAIPIISANMDTVTESKMAIAMARFGGLGIVHRNCSISKQMQEVMNVKSAEEGFIHEPFTLLPDDLVGQARELMAKERIDSILIIGNGRVLLGLITKYEIIRADNSETVGKYMKPRSELIVVEMDHEGFSEKRARELAQEMFAKQNLLGKLPFVYKNGALIGLITKKDMTRYASYPDATKDEKGRLRVGAAIGVGEDTMERAEALMGVGVDILVIDVAHSHAEKPMELLSVLKRHYPDQEIIFGNVATHEAVKCCNLFSSKLEAVKVGIGPGAMCSTRIIAGAGVPQVSAILDCAREAENYKFSVIADGGIRYSRDVTLAIACGAKAVMIGTLLAGTDESPGDLVSENGQLVKIVRGMSSLDVNLEIKGSEFLSGGVRELIQPEGVVKRVNYAGPLERILSALVGGLRSGMTYVGADTIEKLRRPHEGKLTRVSQAAWEESKPHDVGVM